MAVHPTQKICGGYHDEPACAYCRWIMEDNLKMYLDSPKGKKMVAKLRKIKLGDKDGTKDNL